MSTPLELSPPLLPTGLSLESFIGSDNPELLHEIKALRVQVWRASSFPMKPGHESDTHWGDQWDKIGHHFAILNSSAVVAATRVTVHNSIAVTPYPEWFPDVSPEPPPPLLYISRLVVHPNFQRKGLSDVLDAKAIELGRQQDAGAIFCDVPEYRVEPMRKRGFTQTCEPKLGVVFPTMLFTGMMLRLR